MTTQSLGLSQHLKLVASLTYFARDLPGSYSFCRDSECTLLPVDGRASVKRRS